MHFWAVTGIYLVALMWYPGIRAEIARRMENIKAQKNLTCLFQPLVLVLQIEHTQVQV